LELGLFSRPHPAIEPEAHVIDCSSFETVALIPRTFFLEDSPTGRGRKVIVRDKIDLEKTI
jgi:hypothetical protein